MPSLHSLFSHLSSLRLVRSMTTHGQYDLIFYLLFSTRDTAKQMILLTLFYSTLFLFHTTPVHFLYSSFLLSLSLFYAITITVSCLSSKYSTFSCNLSFIPFPCFYTVISHFFTLSRKQSYFFHFFLCFVVYFFGLASWPRETFYNFFCFLIERRREKKWLKIKKDIVSDILVNR